MEEARAVAVPTLLPAAVNDAQDDVSSPVFSAYRRQVRAADCVDSLLAMLAAESSQALFATGRRPAPPLEGLLERLRAVFPPLDDNAHDANRRLGEDAARLAASLQVSAVDGSPIFSARQ